MQILNQVMNDCLKTTPPKRRISMTEIRHHPETQQLKNGRGFVTRGRQPKLPKYGMQQIPANARVIFGRITSGLLQITLEIEIAGPSLLRS